MTDSLHQELHAARHRHPALLTVVAACTGSPRDHHQASAEVESNERKIAELAERVEQLEALILFAHMTLAMIGPTPSTRRLANARTRFEEGLLWLQSELGTPIPEQTEG